MAGRATSAILVSFWRRRELSATAGTAIEWIADLPNVVEVYCTCSPATAVRRFLQRARHPAHGDQGKDVNEILEQFSALDLLGPLGVGRVVTVSTEDHVAIKELARIVSTPPVS
jgi:hypothetical protein